MTLLLSTTLVLTASEKDTIGRTDLLSRMPDPVLNGSGLRVGQVEASTSSTFERYQPNPAAASQPLHPTKNRRKIAVKY